MCWLFQLYLLQIMLSLLQRHDILFQLVDVVCINIMLSYMSLLFAVFAAKLYKYNLLMDFYIYIEKQNITCWWMRNHSSNQTSNWWPKTSWSMVWNMLRNNAKQVLAAIFFFEFGSFVVQCILRLLAAILLGILSEILPKLNLLFFDFIYYF